MSHAVYALHQAPKGQQDQRPCVQLSHTLHSENVFKSCNGEYSSYQHTQSANYYLGYIDSNNKLEKQDNTTGPIKEANNNYNRPTRNTTKANYLREDI